MGDSRWPFFSSCQHEYADCSPEKESGAQPVVMPGSNVICDWLRGQGQVDEGKGEFKQPGFQAIFICVRASR